MITMGTFGGYIIILVGLFAGNVMGTPVNRRVDLFFAVVGCALFIIAGALNIDFFSKLAYKSSFRDTGLAKGSISIIEAALFLVDAFLTFRGENWKDIIFVNTHREPYTRQPFYTVQSHSVMRNCRNFHWEILPKITRITPLNNSREASSKSWIEGKTSKWRDYLMREICLALFALFEKDLWTYLIARCSLGQTVISSWKYHRDTNKLQNKKQSTNVKVPL